MGRLLSYLRSKGATVRLPELETEDLESLAGKFVEALGNGSGGVSNHASGWVESPLAEAEELFQTLEAELASLWSGLRAEVAQDAGGTARGLWPILEPEIGSPSCPLQLAWALHEAGPEIREGLAKVEAVFAAVKRSRPVPVHAGAAVRKCGQCGRREAMGGENTTAWRAFQERLLEVPEVQQGLRINAAEHLCRVCALRRFAGYLTKEAFPRTIISDPRRAWRNIWRRDSPRSAESSPESVGRTAGIPRAWKPWIRFSSAAKN